MKNIPKAWETYTHQSGREYVVQCVTNRDSLHPKSGVNSIKFPPTVVYASIDSGKLYSRPLKDFLVKFTIVEQK